MSGFARRIGFLIGALPLLIAHSVSASAAENAGLLHIGATGIYCVREPCPTRGVFAPARSGAPDRSRLIYAGLFGNAPAPRLEASPEDKARLEEAWSNHDCLVVEGRVLADEGRSGLDVERDLRAEPEKLADAPPPPTVKVDRVIGPCGAR